MVASVMLNRERLESYGYPQSRLDGIFGPKPEPEVEYIDGLLVFGPYPLPPPQPDACVAVVREQELPSGTVALLTTGGWFLRSQVKGVR